MPRRFDLYDVALELIAELRPLVEHLRCRDRDQALQLKKAANAILSNVGEGSRRQGRDRLQHWNSPALAWRALSARREPKARASAASVNIAAGSAAEARLQIQAAIAWGDLEPTLTPSALHLLDRALAMLWRMTH